MRETASKSALMLSGCNRWMHPKASWYQELEGKESEKTKRFEGKLVHEALHMHAQGLPFSIPGHLERKTSKACEYIDKKLKPRGRIVTEVAYGINWENGNVVRPVLETERDYPEDDSFFYGTADVVLYLRNGVVLVADWKTGSSLGAEYQLLSLACMISKINLNSPMRIATLFVGDEGVESNEREVTMAELVDHADKMRKSVELSRSTAHPSLPVIGGHCTELYCPHLAKCPATLHAMDVVVDVPQPNVDFFEEPENTAHAGLMACRLKAIKRAAEYYTDHLKAYVRNGNKAAWGGLEFRDTGNGFRLVQQK